MKEISNNIISIGLDGTCVDVNTNKKHTHTFLYPDKKETKKGETEFSKIILQYSTYPKNYEGKEIHLDTFPDEEGPILLIEIPRTQKLEINLKP